MYIHIYTTYLHFYIPTITYTHTHVHAHTYIHTNTQIHLSPQWGQDWSYNECWSCNECCAPANHRWDTEAFMHLTSFLIGLLRLRADHQVTRIKKSAGSENDSLHLWRNGSFSSINVGSGFQTACVVLSFLVVIKEKEPLNTGQKQVKTRTTFYLGSGKHSQQ